jgi:7-cyano-7-deazaguanine synthase in queuosine biosynthesis
MDYTYIFSDITDRHSEVQILDHQNSQQCNAIVSVEDDHLFWRYLPEMMVVADLVDIGIAVYVADRLSVRRRDKACYIRVSVPVRDVKLFQQLEIVDQLQRALHWFTDDYWMFKFKPRSDYSRRSSRQIGLLHDVRSDAVEVCLWSGGLDSLAGLCNRLGTYPERDFVLLGTGGNKQIRGVQKRVSQTLASRFPGRTELVQIPFNILNPEKVRSSSSQRSRGFVFMLLGMACAYLRGADTLHIYENGVGAINLPYRASEVGLDHSRSVHPRSLKYMSELVSKLLGKLFLFNNPFLYWTKAQMCEVFQEASLHDVVHLTVSCDRRQRQKDRPAQCGCCSSCLLRRQALAVNGTIDQTSYGTDDSNAIVQRGVHLSAMLHQVSVMRACFDRVGSSLALLQQYPELLFDVIEVQAQQQNTSTEDVKGNIVNLYKSYVQEWERVGEAISDGLLYKEQLQMLRDVQLLTKREDT